MRYSNQKWFCNCCGKEMFSPPEFGMGGSFLGYRVCSPHCVREMRWKSVLSNMNSEYYPDPEPYKGD